MAGRLGFIPSIEGWDENLKKDYDAGGKVIYVNKGTGTVVSPASINKLKSQALGRSIERKSGEEYRKDLGFDKKAADTLRGIRKTGGKVLRTIAGIPEEGGIKGRANLETRSATLKPNKHMLNNDKYSNLINKKGLFKNQYTQQVAFKQYENQRDVKGIPEFNIPAQGGTVEQNQQFGIQPRTWTDPWNPAKNVDQQRANFERGLAHNVQKRHEQAFGEGSVAPIPVDTGLSNISKEKDPNLFQTDRQIEQAKLKGEVPKTDFTEWNTDMDINAMPKAAGNLKDIPKPGLLKRLGTAWENSSWADKLGGLAGLLKIASIIGAKDQTDYKIAMNLPVKEWTTGGKKQGGKGITGEEKDDDLVG